MFHNSRRVGVMIALVTGGVVAGGVLASSVAANAEGNAPPQGSGYAGPGASDRVPRGPHRTPLSGDALAKVKAAVDSKYPGATVDFAHADAEGYDAAITKKDGSHTRLELDKAFAVTGEHPGFPDGPGGPRGPRPTPLSGDALAKVKAAIDQKYPGATVEFAIQDRDGSGYDAFVAKKDGSHVRVELDKAFTVTGEDTAPGGRPGGRPDGGPHDGPDGGPLPSPPATQPG